MKGRLVPRPHVEFEGIPYFDEELNVPQGDARTNGTGTHGHHIRARPTRAASVESPPEVEPDSTPIAAPVVSSLGFG